jgi:N-acetylglucosaminyldiphosphoundecaprenol N-acetyl-beta-D-mannosaminyltransferase
MESRLVLGTRVDATSYGDAADRVRRWAMRGESRHVCCANVHMVMEGMDDPAFRAVVNGADLVTADGMPLAWALRLLGVRGAPRVYGPELMLAVCARAGSEGIPVGLLGGTPEALAALEAALARRFPRLRIVHRASPPFRPRSVEERQAARREIAASGARILFVGLGCPKQERWMAAERGRLPAVMLGVGAAFDFISGRKAQAPAPLGRLGLEWAFRLAAEPRRLWRRYLVHNPRFVALFALQLARAARRRRGARRPENEEMER